MRLPSNQIPGKEAVKISRKENNIGKYVQQERRKKGITQEKLAEYTGISWSAISRFETGQSMLSVERLLKIVEALDIGIVAVFCDYVKIVPDMENETTREILKLINGCDDREKQYLLESLRVRLECIRGTMYRGHGLKRE